jgi:serpin B
MKYKILVAGILIIMLIITNSGCLIPPSPNPGPSPSPNPTPPQVSQVLQSDKQRVTSPVASQADLSAVVDGNNAFALDAYQTLKGDKNLFFSPYSISIALAMTYAGAGGTTEQQMADALHFTLPQEKLHPVFNALDLELSQRGLGAKGKDDKGFRLNIVNAIWGQKDYTFLQDFLDILAENYGAGLRLLDFENAPEPSRITINDWVSDQTEGRIKDLIPPGSISGITRLVLTNAIYFNAAWQNAFQKEATSDGTFYLLDRNEITVPMMHQTEWFNYTEGSDYQAVELPYDGNELSMLVLLPKAGQFTAFEDSLDAGKVASVVQALDNKKVVLTMPKLEFTSSFNLNAALSDMGMPVAFVSPPEPGLPCSTRYANFSGMIGKCDLYISDVIHKAFISVAETGTEAAAATAVIIGMATASPQMEPEQIVYMTIDHPFIFLIRDIQTGTILFVGRVMNPGT